MTGLPLEGTLFGLAVGWAAEVPASLNQLDRTLNEVRPSWSAADPTPVGLPAGERMQEVPPGIRCLLPQVAGGSECEILGTVRRSTSRHSAQVLTTTGSIVLAGCESGGNVSWEALRRTPGHCALQRLPKPRGVADLASRLLDDPGRGEASRLNLDGIIGRALREMGHRSAVPPRRFRLVVTCPHKSDRDVVDDTEDPRADPDVEIESVLEDRRSGTESAVTLINVRFRTALSFLEFSEVFDSLTQVAEHVFSHLRRLDIASENLRNQSLLLKGLEESSESERAELLRDLLRLRAFYVAGLGSEWHIGRNMPTWLSKIAGILDERLSVTGAWQMQMVQFENIGRIADAYSVLPDPDPELPTHELDARHKEILADRNPFRQVLAFLSYRRSLPDEENEKEIHLHPYSNRDAMFEELQSSLSVTIMMTATAGIILGLLMQFSFGRTSELGGYPLDILYLFVATFAFFLSTLMAANGVSRLARTSSYMIDLDLERAAIMSEYVGKYCFLVAIPLAVIRFMTQNQLNHHPPIVITVAVIGWLTFVGYHLFTRVARIYTDFGTLAVGSDLLRNLVIIVMSVLVGLVLAWPVGSLPIPALQDVFGLVLLGIFIALLALALATPAPLDRAHYRVDRWDALGKEVGEVRKQDYFYARER